MAIAGVRLDSKGAQVVANSLLEIAPKPVRSLAQLPPLSVGQEVEAEVVEELSDGLVLMNIAGALLTAEASDALPTGQAFSARVEQLQPQVVLKVFAEAEEGADASAGQQVQAEAARLLRAAIPHHTEAAESFNALTQELASFVEHSTQDIIPQSLIKLQNLIKTFLPEQTPPTAAQLAAFIRDGGLQYEAKLLRAAASNLQALSHVAEEDLKGLLFQALQDLAAAQQLRTGLSDDSLEEMSTSSPASIAASLAHHLEHIESQQAVNILAQAQGEPYQLQVPFCTGQSIATAYLSIEPDGKNQKETEKRGNGETGKGYNILFALDLENFGQTRIDARVGEKSLWAVFYVDQGDSVALLRQELPDFRDTLQSLGYEEVLLVAKPLRQLAPEKRQKFEALTVGVPASVHLLDMKA